MFLLHILVGLVRLAVSAVEVAATVVGLILFIAMIMLFSCVRACNAEYARKGWPHYSTVDVPEPETPAK